MSVNLNEQQDLYADLLIKIGINLQPGQRLVIRSELEHADFTRRVVGAAYRAGAQYVSVQWDDDLTARQRMLYSQPDYLDIYPDFEVARFRGYLDEGWARLALVGAQTPDAFDEIDPKVMLRLQQGRAKRTKFYAEAMMANRLQWCVAGVPTQAWAHQVFPDLPGEQAVERLWQVILQTVRADRPDPVAAWQQHDATLKGITQFMATNQVTAIHYFDPAPGPDGQPSSDLTIGLTERPLWVGASSVTPAGVSFLPNMPTEEVFCTPHRERASGYVRTSKPAFPFDRKVDQAYFRFDQGVVVEFQAATGLDVLTEFFQIAHANRLGEVSLVDVRSPVNQSGLLFYETLFDENAVCHIAFGKAYPECLAGAAELTPEQLVAAGVNDSDIHVDFMIGTPTMQVAGMRADGTRLAIMENGQFVSSILK
jgi:aminopeptidase